MSNMRDRMNNGDQEGNMENAVVAGVHLDFQSTAVKLINEILYNNHIMSSIKTNDYYSFQKELRGNYGQLNTEFVKTKDVFILTACSLISVETGKEVKIADKLVKKAIGQVGFPYLWLKTESRKNCVIIVKDYDLLFKARKEMLKQLHSVEEEYFNLERDNNKIVFLTKTDMIEVLPNLDLEIASFEYSNEPLRKAMLEDAKTNGFLDAGINVERLLKASSALTLQELMMVCKDKENPFNSLERQKRERILKINPEIKIEDFDLKFKDVIGFHNAKQFLERIMDSGKGKAMLLLGVPGAGKSMLAKALGGQLGLPTISLSLGALQNKFVGETDHITKRVLDAINAYGKAIVFIDEIDKGLAGAAGGGGDSGTSQRQAGEFLKWMNDRTPGQGYVIATANNIDALPPEYCRAGRWDMIFFADFPSRNDLEELCDYYAEKYNVIQPLPDLDELVRFKFTGAEVDGLYSTAAVMDCSLKEAMAYVNKIGANYNGDAYRSRFIGA